MATAFRPHVLVVDDDPGIHDALSAALADRYAIHTASTGAEGCACLRAHPIAAIILDAILRDEHGLALVGPFRTIRAVPIILLTGHSSEELAIRAVRHRVAGYLKKPCSLPAMLAAVGRIVPHTASPADLAARARRYLDEHGTKAFRAAALAGQLGISEAHLRWLFRTAYGKTPRRYVAELRIERAATLLRTTACGVERIALEIGFPNVVWFNKTFKQAYGVSPSAFRAQLRRASHGPVPRGSLNRSGRLPT